LKILAGEWSKLSTYSLILDQFLMVLEKTFEYNRV
jgi:hypothetical protein